MTVPDRSDHVLTAIEGALQDYETSPDAMRWTPEPPVKQEKESLFEVQQLRFEAQLQGRIQSVVDELNRRFPHVRWEWRDSDDA